MFSIIKKSNGVHNYQANVKRTKFQKQLLFSSKSFKSKENSKWWKYLLLNYLSQEKLSRKRWNLNHHILVCHHINFLILPRTYSWKGKENFEKKNGFDDFCLKSFFKTIQIDVSLCSCERYYEKDPCIVFVNF